MVGCCCCFPFLYNYHHHHHHHHHHHGRRQYYYYHHHYHLYYFYYHHYYHHYYYCYYYCYYKWCYSTYRPPVTAMYRSIGGGWGWGRAVNVPKFWRRGGGMKHWCRGKLTNRIKLLLSVVSTKVVNTCDHAYKYDLLNE